MRPTPCLFALALCLGCSTADRERSPDVRNPSTANEPTSVDPKIGDPSAPDRIPGFQPTSKDVTALAVQGQTELAAALYTKLEGTAGDKDQSNLVFSPTSISTAFGMTYAGAKGETARQMAGALHYKLPQDRIHAAFGTQLRRWNEGGTSRPYDLAVANRLFGERDFTFKEGFLGVTSDHYQAALEPVDFKNAPEAARQTINHWVEGRTKERIKDLLPEGSIRSVTRLVLTNAVYLKADWKNPFVEYATEQEPFTTPTGDVNVPMMHTHGAHRFAQVGGATMLELPYKGDDLVMQLVLPDDEKGLGALEDKLAAGALDDLAGALSEEHVAVAIPRFTIRPTESLSLKAIFQSMGMVDAFDKQKADLSGMADITDGRLFIDDAFHKAFVAVDEKGTEAAAASAVVVAIESAAPPAPAMKKEFKADHPFIFAIRDKKTGALLFLGRVTHPEK